MLLSLLVFTVMQAPVWLYVGGHKTDAAYYMHQEDLCTSGTESGGSTDVSNFSARVSDSTTYSILWLNYIYILYVGSKEKMKKRPPLQTMCLYHHQWNNCELN